MGFYIKDIIYDQPALIYFLFYFRDVVFIILSNNSFNEAFGMGYCHEKKIMLFNGNLFGVWRFILFRLMTK